jgi:hypothetical protein
MAGLSLEFTVNTWNLRSLSQVPCPLRHGFRFPRRLTRRRTILMCSDSSSQSWNVPVLSSYEVIMVSLLCLYLSIISLTLETVHNLLARDVY